MKQTIKQAIVLIPSLEPDGRLPVYVKELREYGLSRIVIVDDGSGNEYQDIFKELEEFGCTLLRHSVNRGKGLALKTGYEYIRRNMPGFGVSGQEGIYRILHSDKGLALELEE